MCVWEHVDVAVDLMLNFLGWNVLAKSCDVVQVHQTGFKHQTRTQDLRASAAMQDLLMCRGPAHLNVSTPHSLQVRISILTYQMSLPLKCRQGLSYFANEKLLSPQSWSLGTSDNFSYSLYGSLSRPLIMYLFLFFFCSTHFKLLLLNQNQELRMERVPSNQIYIFVYFPYPSIPLVFCLLLF